MMVESIVDQLKNRLENEIGVVIKRYWLSECVSYFQSNNPRISPDELYNGAYQQILLADIESCCEPTIPREFRTNSEIWMMQKKFLFVQMQSILEITESFYEQWRRLHNMRLDEVNEIKESKSFQVKKKRCFKLILFDGVDKIEAMEYRPIACLNTKLAPGVKILIRGPVKVSNKIILLESQNIQILGGEVDELLIENAYENVLLKLLNRPTTKTPITDYVEEKFEAETNRPAQSNRPPPSAPININRPANPPDAMDEEMKQLSIDDNEIDLDFLEQIEAAEKEFQKKEEEKQKSQAPVVVAPKQNPINLTNEDDFSETFLKRLEDELMEEEEPIPVPPKSNQTSWGESSKTSASSWSSYNQKSSAKVVPAAKSAFTNPWNPPARTSPSAPLKQPKLTLTNPWNQSKKKEETKKSTFFDSFYEKNSEKPPSPPPPPAEPEKKIPVTRELLIPAGFENAEKDSDDFEMLAKRKSGDDVLSPIHKTKAPRVARTTTTTILDDDYEYKINYTHNFVFIDEFVKLRNLDKLKRVFVVEASVSKVRLMRVEKTCWNLLVEISDEWSKEQLPVRFDSEIVAGFAGHSAQEVYQYHEKIKIQPQLREDLMNILKRISEAVQEKKYLMLLTTKVQPPNEFEVTVTKLLEKTDDNKRAIMLKIFDLGREKDN